MAAATASVAATAALEQICDAWPPASESAPAVNQGTKTLDGYMDGKIRETLHDLHDGAWWTGIKISAPRRGTASFKVKVVKNDGTKLWPSWTQNEGDWTHFPWPVPAVVARELGLCVQIKQVDSDTNGCIFTRRVLSFVECPGISAEEPLLFVDDDGDIRGYWDGAQGRFVHYSERDDTDVGTPHWGSPHTVVPMMDDLVTRRNWLSYRTFTPTSWSSSVRFPM